jgi:surface polysaccharide O-acyltransferase-like enzyme
MASDRPTQTFAPSVWRSIPFIRGVAIAAVILCHATERSLGIIGLLDGKPVEQPVWEVIVELMVRGTAAVAVPAFFFVSGFMVFRFSKTRKAAWAAARSIAVRYCLWAIPGYVVLAIVHKKLDIGAVLLDFVTDGPYGGTYWFLVVLFQLCVVAPLLVRWVEKSFVSATLSCVGLQLLVSAHFYVVIVQSGLAVPSRNALARLPFYLGGMIVSSRSDEIVQFLSARRRWLEAIAIGSQLLVLAECVLWGLWAGDGSPRSWIYGDDKLAVSISTVALLAWWVARPSRKTRVSAWLEAMGTQSMAILLMSDLFFAATVPTLWHAGELFGMPRLPPGVVPGYMRSLWIAVPFLVAGLAGPLLSAKAIERFFGRGARKFLFG